MDDIFVIFFILEKEKKRILLIKFFCLSYKIFIYIVDCCVVSSGNII